jgi:4'-phosphopantetheinyl transferase
MVYLFDSIESFDENDYQQSLCYLTKERQKKAETYRFFKDKRLSVLAYLLLSYALKEEYGVDSPGIMGYGSHGKPYLCAHENIQFNLSHCSVAAACAVSANNVGVDVQDIAKENHAVMKRVMHPNEIRQIEESEDISAEFTRLWSRKESYLKFRGTGLTNNMSELDLALVQCVSDNNKNDFGIYTKRIDNYYISVCGYEPVIIKRIGRKDLLDQI